MPTFFEDHIITVQCTVSTLYIIHTWNFDNQTKKKKMVACTIIFTLYSAFIC